MTTSSNLNWAQLSSRKFDSVKFWLKFILEAWMTDKEYWQKRDGSSYGNADKLYSDLVAWIDSLEESTYGPFLVLDRLQEILEKITPLSNALQPPYVFPSNNHQIHARVRLVKGLNNVPYLEVAWFGLYDWRCEEEIFFLYRPYDDPILFVRWQIGKYYDGSGEEPVLSLPGKALEYLQLNSEAKVLPFTNHYQTVLDKIMGVDVKDVQPGFEGVRHCQSLWQEISEEILAEAKKEAEQQGFATM